MELDEEIAISPSLWLMAYPIPFESKTIKIEQ
jgi:hypothetical protein